MTPTDTEYWEPLWASGRRYRPLGDEENALLVEHVGPGAGRPALDIGCGEGALARHLHESLGFRTVGIDCSPTALALAARAHGDVRGLTFQRQDFVADDPGRLPHPAYAVITCRLVYRWVEDKSAFLNRVRALLVPGGTFWLVAESADRLEGDAKYRGLTAAACEGLTAGWFTRRVLRLDRLLCFALRP